MAVRHLAAVDLGAESGRVMLARFDGTQLSLEEVHRFSNQALWIKGQRFWNMQALWNGVLAGLRKARQLATGPLASIGVDSWAVDYGLVDEQGILLTPPFQYRDARTVGMMEQVCAQIPRATLYARTGIQFLPFNTLFQLYAHQRMDSAALARAHRLLMIPDLFHTRLCGSLLTERTNASTTQCWDAAKGEWASDLLAQLTLPTSILPPVVEAGTALGPLLTQWRADLGEALVIAPATHDTASAIAATPVEGPGHWGYISSGTWSLVGVELEQPLTTPAALAANCTNEGGVFGTTRFLKNVMGLWLLQECQRRWAQEGRAPDYEALFTRVDTVAPFSALIDPDDARFLAPDDMPAAINAYLREHKQAELQQPEAFARCIMESLVLRYCAVFEQISQLTQKPLARVYVLGGGARNTRLNTWLADALNVPVIAGSAEATAQGNALLQLVGLGELQNLSEVRAIGRNAPTQTFLPRPGQNALWHAMAQRFQTLCATSEKIE